MNFRIGCAVWSYKGWVGDFYPSGSRTTDFLQLYSQRLTTVEGNTTFYAVPNQETITRWAKDVSPGFEFCLKLPRELTHKGLLQDSIAGALSFIEQVRGLGDRLGPIFAQLPPRYSPDLLEDLTSFLSALSQTQVSLALEVRHPDWFREPHANQLHQVLSQLGVGRVLLDSRPIYHGSDNWQIKAERRKPQLPLQLSLTAPFSLIRFISHPQREANQKFLTEWVVNVEQWLRQGKQIYFFVHCPIEARSPGTARSFQQLLEQHGVPVPPLPWNHLEQPPNQLSLF